MEDTVSERSVIAYLGTGGRTPGLHALLEDGEAVPVEQAESSQSVYAIDSSAEGSRLICGTRASRGRVDLWDRRADGQIIGAQVAAWYQPGPVTSVAMATETIAMSGGLDGKVRIWSAEDRHKCVAVLSAHEGPVLAVRALSSQIAASVGADNLLRIWDLDHLSCAHEISLSTEEACVRNLLALAFAPDLGLLISHDRCGGVFTHEVREDLASARLKLPGGPVSSMALVGEALVVSDLRSSVLRVLRPSDGEELDSASVDRPVLQLAALDTDRFLVAYRDGAAEIWTKNRRLSRERGLRVTDVRSICGPPRVSQLERGRFDRSANRENAIASARAAAESGDLESLRRMLEGLAENEMGVEALVLLADACEKRGKLLWALEVRLALTEDMPKEEWCAPHLYTLADLLERMGEPERALEEFERARECHDSYRDTAKRIERLMRGGLPSPCTEGAVRDDLVGDDAGVDLGTVRDALQRDRLLGRVWDGPVTVERHRHALRSASVDLDDVQRALESDEWVLERDMSVRGPESDRTSVIWLCRDSDTELGAGLRYAVETETTAGRARIVHRVVLFTPSDVVGEEVEQWLDSSLARLQVREIASWMETVRAQVNSAAQRAVAERSARAARDPFARTEQ